MGCNRDAACVFSASKILFQGIRYYLPNRLPHELSDILVLALGTDPPVLPHFLTGKLANFTSQLFHLEYQKRKLESPKHTAKMDEFTDDTASLVDMPGTPSRANIQETVLSIKVNVQILLDRVLKLEELLQVPEPGKQDSSA